MFVAVTHLLNACFIVRSLFLYPLLHLLAVFERKVDLIRIHLDSKSAIFNRINICVSSCAIPLHHHPPLWVITCTGFMPNKYAYLKPESIILACTQYTPNEYSHLHTFYGFFNVLQEENCKPIHKNTNDFSLFELILAFHWQQKIDLEVGLKV